MKFLNFLCVWVIYQQFVNKNITGIKAVRIIYNEKARILAKRQNIKATDVYGWVYGVNVGITNKKGDITQTMLLVAAVAESTGIYGLVIAIILIFANPWIR